MIETARGDIKNITHILTLYFFAPFCTLGDKTASRWAIIEETTLECDCDVTPKSSDASTLAARRNLAGFFTFGVDEVLAAGDS